MTRDEEIEYADENGIPVPANLENPYSIDANIWGRACEAGVLENPWNEAPEGAFDWTTPIELTPDDAEYIEIEFEQGVPVALNGEKLPIGSINRNIKCCLEANMVSAVLIILKID